MRVLLVDGLTNQTESWNTFLRSEGLAVECAETSDDVLGLLRHYPFDLVLLNLASNMEGALPISRLRAAGHHMPVIALMNASNAKQRLAALSAGADDVLGQDVDPAEILARMRAVFRRYRGFSQPIIRCGEVTLDQECQDVAIKGKHIHFTRKEFEILQLLMLRKNTVMTKEAILANLYGGMDEPEIKIIDVFICKIRSKLAKAGVPSLIGTVWGRGYVVQDDRRDNTATPEPSAPMPVKVTGREFAMA